MTPRKTAALWAAALLAALLAASSVHAVRPASDFYLENMPGLDPEEDAKLRMHAGHLAVPEGDDRALFFWMVESTFDITANRLVIWFNGGPGCSSMDGMFLEQGPFRVNGEKVTINPHSWHHHAALLFVDQPFGTGFSYTEKDRYLHSEGEVSSYMVQFLAGFLDVFPQFRKAEIFLSGESYAGVYIPYIAKAILDANTAGNIFKHPLRLSGLLIGNGWMDPARQYRGYVDYAKEHDLLPGNAASEMEATWDACKKILDTQKQERIKSMICESLVDVVTTASQAGGKMCINIYDIRLRDFEPHQGCGLYSWPPLLKSTKAYLQRNDVVKFLRVEKKQTKWAECDSRAGSALDDDQSLPSYLLLPELLTKVPVLLFSGDQDFICNWRGTEAMVDALNWNGAVGMQKAPRQPWYVQGEEKPVGWIQTSRNLSFVLIYNASHMVPVDKPEAALGLLQTFLVVEHQGYTVSALWIHKPHPPDTSDIIRGRSLPPWMTMMMMR
ncbi:Alpha/Beta hydrolase protein [Cladochytrium replicatum]|nr:Alpha/Beta hydrolase protein [Cladochytrium replicatum]